MPLEPGKSKAAFSHNVEVEVEAGKPQKQAVAIAYAEKRRGKDKRRAKDLEIDCSVRATDAAFRRLAFDRSSLRTKDVNGWLHIRDCRISKANVCPYLGREIPYSEKLGLVNDRVYYMYRDASALSAAAYTGERIPLMLEHLAVTAETAQQREVKRKLVGAVSNVRWMPPYLVADLTVWDGEGIEAIESERQTELSPGYNYRPEMLSGVINGERYDGRMLDIVFNHLCLVDTGRTGPDVAVNDRALVIRLT